MSAGRFLAWVVLASIGPAIAALTTSALAQSLIAQATFSAMFALGVGLLLRQNGMVSFGHAAFFGLPGYMLGALLPLNLLPVEVMICATVVLIGILAFIIGLVIVRAHGIAFGMLTLAVGQAVYEAATRLRGLTGGNDGLSLRLPKHLFGLSLKTLQQPAGMLTVSWLVMVAMLAIVSVFAASRFGILTEAIRDNEERARFLGYRTLLPRAAVLGLSAAVTAVGGVMFALYNAFISPDNVHWTASGSALIMAILGGSGAPWGPVAGAFVYFFLKESLDSFTTHWLSIIGAALIIITVVFPAGLAGLVPWAIALRQREAHIARA
ncbi:MAG TPA: branched-chain amino acid ABC transporter permease [Xanthobacteraceae bacterium]|nr:branched-chain amino acid ABC transporter permease [Xanthobacteraceae bacterium]